MDFSIEKFNNNDFNENDDKFAESTIQNDKSFWNASAINENSSFISINECVHYIIDNNNDLHRFKFIY